MLCYMLFVDQLMSNKACTITTTYPLGEETAGSWGYDTTVHFFMCVVLYISG